MSSDGLRLWLIVVCACLVGGCANVPPASAQSQSLDQGNGEYDGRLFKSLTGRRTADQAASPAAPASGGATPAGASGPLMAGPASPSAARVASSPTGSALIPVSAEMSVAGPPPTIPPDLLAPPSGAVRLDEAKAKAEEKKGFELSDLAPENVYKNVRKATGYGPNENIARAAGKEGKALFLDEKYKEAAAKFATAADRWPDSPLEEESLFLKGESEFFSDQYRKAHDTYGGLLKKYSNTRYLDTVAAREFIIGQYWEQLQEAKPLWTIAPNLTDNGRPMFDTFGYAIQAYERVRLNDPTGPRADDSVFATANLYFRRGQFENAAYQYDQLIKEYPNSEFQAKAHILGLQAKMRIYQGTMYIGAPLDDAQKIADQTLEHYGDKLGDERQRVAQARAQIIEEKANRDFSLGQYYERHKSYGAARMYYKSLIEQYPSTGKAKEAQARLDAIRSEPDTPPSRLAWLTGLFGTKK